MILLKAGYDFFRQVPISGLLVQERSKYYKAIRQTQAPENGYDLTYFLNYYADMLVRTASDMHERIAAMQRIRALEAQLPEGTARERVLKGAHWLLA